jgi:hypothetical protein
MPRTLQFRRLPAPTLANTTGADGELIINTSNKTLTVHDGALPGGYALLNSITDNNIDQTARNTANTASNNIVILQGVNTTQNTDITNATSIAQAAFNQANNSTGEIFFQGTVLTAPFETDFLIETSDAEINFWTFGSDATLTFPDNTVQNTAFTGTAIDPVAREAANTKFSSSGGTVTGNVTISGILNVTSTINVNNVLTVLTSPPAASPSITIFTTQNQELRLRAVSNTWTFIANGSLVFPDNTSQTTAFTGSAIDQDARNSANAAAQTIPQNAQSTDYTLQLTDAGKHIYYTQASDTTLYIPTTSNVTFSNGSTIMIISATSAGANVTISPNTGVTMYLAGNTINASRNVTTYGMATLIQVAANTWFINGTGVA